MEIVLIKETNSWIISIVAVHGLNESMVGAWTHQETGVLWLRDFLPEAIPVARVLAFGYESSRASFYGSGCADTVRKNAHTLVASLQADRSIEGCDYRPILFVCHGLGGILVKKALAYSISKTSSQVQHLYTIFVSTYAILFFGTPHDRVNPTRSFTVDSGRRSSGSSYDVQEDDSNTLQSITEQFAPLMKKFRIYFFWEESPTDFGGHKRFLVEEESAAPTMDNTERCGIDATHAGMVKFPAADSSSYRTVIAALARYCKDAPTIIVRRWEKELETLARTRSNDASELVGPDYKIHIDPSIWLNNGAVERKKYYFAPQETSTAFVGRREILKVIQEALCASESSLSQRSQKRFVIYGMGGCGKTELCCKFAQENKERFSAIFTIHAKSPQTAKESFSAIGKVGGLEATESAGKYWLSRLKEPWLLIIDNADNPDLNLKGLFPRGDKCHILITTRNPDFRIHGTTGCIELKGLKEWEAVYLLLERA